MNTGAATASADGRSKFRRRSTHRGGDCGIISRSGKRGDIYGAQDNVDSARRGDGSAHGLLYVLLFAGIEKGNGK